MYVLAEAQQLVWCAPSLGGGNNLDARWGYRPWTCSANEVRVLGAHHRWPAPLPRSTVGKLQPSASLRRGGLPGLALEQTERGTLKIARSTVSLRVEISIPGEMPRVDIGIGVDTGVLRQVTLGIDGGIVVAAGVRGHLDQARSVSDPVGVVLHRCR